MEKETLLLTQTTLGLLAERGLSDLFDLLAERRGQFIRGEIPANELLRAVNRCLVWVD